MVRSSNASLQVWMGDLEKIGISVAELSVLGCILYRDYSIKFYFGLVSVKTVLYAVFSFGTANLMNDGWRNMLFYYMIETIAWLYIFFRVRRREQK